MKRLINVLIGVLIGTAVTLLCMLAFSAITMFFDVDRGFLPFFATASIAVGGLTASMYAAKKIGDRGYLVGIIVGLAVFAVITLISLAVSDGGITYNTLFHLLIITLSSAIGGIIGVNIGKNKKYI